MSCYLHFKSGTIHWPTGAHLTFGPFYNICFLILLSRLLSFINLVTLYDIDGHTYILFDAKATPNYKFFIENQYIYMAWFLPSILWRRVETTNNKYFCAYPHSLNSWNIWIAQYQNLIKLYDSGTIILHIYSPILNYHYYSDLWFTSNRYLIQNLFIIDSNVFTITQIFFFFLFYIFWAKSVLIWTFILRKSNSLFQLLRISQLAAMEALKEPSTLSLVCRTNYYFPK